ncbi:MAG: asparagine synthase-related protein, partial [Pyrinomonadaceae bacterium]|nr:asparagine synthase-related protein [Pyrinomonadaceae bacterium]
MAQPQISQNSAEQKEQQLRNLMREMQSVLVAFSGGVDSSYIALIANQELKENALCVMGISPSVAEKEREMATSIANNFQLNFQTIETDELNNPNYQANPNNRCYFCKTELYGKLNNIADGRTILDGSTTDDLGDYRPGR